MQQATGLLMHRLSFNVKHTLVVFTLLFSLGAIAGDKPVRSITLHPDQLSQLEDREQFGKLEELIIEGDHGNDTLKELPLCIIYLDSLKEITINEVTGMNWTQCYTTLAALPNLRTLIIEGGYGSGEIVVRKLAALQQLTKLDITSGDNSPSFDPVYTLHGLEELHLTACGLQEVSPKIGELTHLKILDLSFNNFKHPLPPQLQQLKNLQYIDCTWSGLKGFPAELIHLPLLETIELSHNRISNLPDSIVYLQHLTILHLEWTQIRELPAGMENLKWLRELDISFTHMRSLPAGLAGCSGLKELYCWNPHFHEKDPVLEVLILSTWLTREKLNDTIAKRYSKIIKGWDEVFADGNKMSLRRDFDQDVRTDYDRNFKSSIDQNNPVFGGDYDDYQSVMDFTRWRERKTPAYSTVTDLDVWYDYPILPFGYKQYRNVKTVEIIRDEPWMSSKRLLRPLRNNPVEELTIEDAYMRRVPRSIREMKQLRELTLNCPNMKELPEWLAELPNLQELKVNTGVIIPDAIKNNSRIKITYL